MFLEPVAFLAAAALRGIAGLSALNLNGVFPEIEEPKCTCSRAVTIF